MKKSVAMCTYNGKDHVREQLLSIREQTLPVDEIIVCDDGSTDGTIALVREISRQYNLPVRLFCNARNLGFQKNFEQAICRCSGDIIFLSDQDDIWLPTKVEKIADYFDRHLDKDFVFTNATLINAGGAASYNQTLFDVLRLDRYTLDLFDRGHALEILSIYCRVTGATCALRASFMPYCIPLSKTIAHDAALAIIAALHGKIGYLDECLIKYRQHKEQTIGLRVSIKHPAERWETSHNLIMWHEMLIEPDDDVSRNRLRFVFLRFWMIRSPWALLNIIRMYVSGKYRRFYMNDKSVFLWDIRSVFIRLWHRILSLKRIEVRIAKD